MHFFRHSVHCLHPQSCQGQLVLENLLLLLDGEEVLVQWAESLKRFQTRVEVEKVEARVVKVAEVTAHAMEVYQVQK